MLPYKIISADVYIHKIKIIFLLVDTLEIFSGKKSDIHNHSNFEKELRFFLLHSIFHHKNAIELRILHIKYIILLLYHSF